MFRPLKDGRQQAPGSEPQVPAFLRDGLQTFPGTVIEIGKTSVKVRVNGHRPINVIGRELWMTYNRSVWVTVTVEQGKLPQSIPAQSVKPRD
jgi:hypothetical protein